MQRLEEANQMLGFLQVSMTGQDHLELNSEALAGYDIILDKVRDSLNDVISRRNS